MRQQYFCQVWCKRMQSEWIHRKTLAIHRLLPENREEIFRERTSIQYFTDFYFYIDIDQCEQNKKKETYQGNQQTERKELIFCLSIRRFKKSMTTNTKIDRCRSKTISQNNIRLSEWMMISVNDFHMNLPVNIHYYSNQLLLSSVY